jgi:DNA-binding transcriptional LysR family regulator
MLNLVRLRVLAAVARLGSVTEAANDLHYTQPTVSHHLSRLESEIGMRLTLKHGRRIRLTPAGELLARRASEILGRMEATEDELAALAELRTGRVRIAGFQSALSSVVAQAAGTLTASYPGIELSLEDLHPEVAIQRLRQGAIDVAVVFRHDGALPEDVHFRHLFDDPMYLMSRQPGQTLVDHRESQWIAGCEQCRNDLINACAREGFTPQVTCTSDDADVKQALVAAGIGVSTIPGLAMQSHRLPGIEVSEVSAFRRSIHVATFGEPPASPAIESFVEALIDAVTDRIATRPTAESGCDSDGGSTTVGP